MPSRDANGKRLPGSGQRQRAAERTRPDRPKTAESRSTKQPSKRAEQETEQDIGADPFDIDPAPIHDTSKMITWGAQLHALVLEKIARDPSAYPNRREWYRAMLGGTTSLGIIRDKAAEQQKIDEALRRDEVKQKKQGLANVSGRKAPSVTRPTG